jgi:hypothetical protein
MPFEALYMLPVPLMEGALASWMLLSWLPYGNLCREKIPTSIAKALFAFMLKLDQAM